MEFHVLNLSKLKFQLVHDHAPKLFYESTIIAQVEIMIGFRNYLIYGIHPQMNNLIKAIHPKRD
jgi:hypothetical protein